MSNQKCILCPTPALLSTQGENLSGFSGPRFQILSPASTGSWCLIPLSNGQSPAQTASARALCGSGWARAHVLGENSWSFGVRDCLDWEGVPEASTRAFMWEGLTSSPLIRKEHTLAIGEGSVLRLPYCPHSGVIHGGRSHSQALPHAPVLRGLCHLCSGVCLHHCCLPLLQVGRRTQCSSTSV